MIRLSTLLPGKLGVKWRFFLMRVKLYKAYAEDASIFFSHSNFRYLSETKVKLLGLIVTEYHAIEKGLSMPDMRLGFGKAVILSLIKHCRIYREAGYPADDIQWRKAISVIMEYKEVHKGYHMDKDIEENISILLTICPEIEPSIQKVMNAETYFSNVKATFDEFSNSRHSVRHFSSDIVPLNAIEQAIELAQNAPSACNRQPSRVYIVSDKQKLSQIVAIQNGNRGFGQLVDKIIVIAAEVGVFLNAEERNEPFINGGMYAMNLLYALHFNKVAACTLNWSATKENDRLLHAICQIPRSERVIMLIACGSIKGDFKITDSLRNNYKTIINIP